MEGLYFPDPFGLDEIIWLILANEMWMKVMLKTEEYLRIGVLIHIPFFTDMVTTSHLLVVLYIEGSLVL